MSDLPRIELAASGASAQEAAAMIAAVEQFLRDTAPEPAAPATPPGPGAWQRAALAEGVSRRPDLPA